jgi:very-short-patch-repair endonuclease
MTDLPRDFRAQAYLLVDAQVDYWQNEFEQICESPIEVAFAVAFMAVGYHEAGRVALLLAEHDDLERAGIDAKRFLRVQRKIDPYRVDFLIGASLSDAAPAIVVECDGHDYHERTKEQAARDRSRDRELQSRGFKVFRFTGSEIYRDAFKCAREVHKQLWLMEVEADK